MLVAVTGASGFLGRWVLEELLAQGASVRALGAPAGLTSPRITWIPGRLPADLPADFPGPGVDWLIHLAARYAEGESARASLWHENVHGTRALIEAARAAKVGRFVHCSTMGTAGPSADGRPATEADLPDPARLSPYNASKWAAEALVQEAEDLDRVIVNPAAPVGAYDHRPTVTGQRLRDLIQGRMPRLLAGPINCVPARDVARGLLLAAATGRSGQRYLLGGENLGPADFLERAARAASVPCPHRTLIDRLLGRRTLQPGSLAIDDAKARRELGYRPSDLDQAFREAAAWHRMELARIEPREGRP